MKRKIYSAFDRISLETAVGSEQEKKAVATVEVEGIPFPREIAGAKTLSLVGHGKY